MITDSNFRFIKLLNFCLSFIIIIGIISYYLNYILWTQSERTVASVMDSHVMNFNERIILIHNLWNADSKRKKFFLPSWTKFNNIEGKRPIGFLMSDNGWPMDVIDDQDNASPCEKIWKNIIDSKDFYIEKLKVVQHSDYCVFSTSQVEIEYYFHTGVIKSSNTL